jgi:hypothetical protein
LASSFSVYGEHPGDPSSPKTYAFVCQAPV